jgi:hypothetical protein
MTPWGDARNEGIGEEMTDAYPRDIIDGHLIEITMKVISAFSPRNNPVRGPINVPGAFMLENKTVRLFLSDADPDNNVRIWTVRFDAFDWRAWVRPLGGFNAFGTSGIYDEPDPDYNAARLRHGVFQTQWVTEFTSLSSNRGIDRAYDDALEWLEKHHITFADKYAEFERGKLKRKFLAFFG